MKQPTDHQYIAAAIEQYEAPLRSGDANIEIARDGDEVTSPVCRTDEDGAWVLAWVYVRNSDIPGLDGEGATDGTA
ncbi:MAG: hypothetical protein ACK4S4_15645 [Pyrinomonadaceae bacterium]